MALGRDRRGQRSGRKRSLPISEWRGRRPVRRRRTRLAGAHELRPRRMGNRPRIRAPNAVVVGWDLRSGEEKDRIHVNNLRSPEHHHRLLPQQGDHPLFDQLLRRRPNTSISRATDHGMNNFVRGCLQKRHDALQRNALCAAPTSASANPGAKLLGYAALKRDAVSAIEPVDDAKRPHHRSGSRQSRTRQDVAPADWPTFRYDARRMGLDPDERGPQGPPSTGKSNSARKLTAPVMADGKLFVAQPEAHTVHALEAARRQVTLEPSPPADASTRRPHSHNGTILFGSADGHALLPASL